MRALGTTKAEIGNCGPNSFFYKMVNNELISWSIQGKTLKLNSAEDVSDYVDQINEISGLQQICLSGNTFGVEACRAIAQALKKQTDIQVLSIDPGSFIC